MSIFVATKSIRLFFNDTLLIELLSQTVSGLRFFTCSTQMPFRKIISVYRLSSSAIECHFPQSLQNNIIYVNLIG